MLPQLRTQGPPTRETSDVDLEETDEEVDGWYIGLVSLRTGDGEALLFLDRTVHSAKRTLWYGVCCATRSSLYRVEAAAVEHWSPQPKPKTPAIAARRDAPKIDLYGPEEFYYGWYELDAPDFSMVPSLPLRTRIIDRLTTLLGAVGTVRQAPEIRVDATIRARRGQAGFRRLLMTRFGERCCVTGSRVAAVLEAAHIVTHDGRDDHSPGNGLLLRSDIHSLFDLGHLAVHPDTFTVGLHPALLETEYGELEGQPLVLPPRLLSAINRDGLRDRWRAFERSRHGSARA